MTSNTSTAPDEVKEPTKAEAREMREEANAAHERGYTVGSWNGVPHYKSTFDEFDTVDEEVMKEYVENHRNGLGIYGATSNQQLTPAQRMNARHRGKPKS